MIIFFSISLNMCFGCSKELSHRDSSFEYPQHMFWLRNKKYNFQLPALIWGHGWLKKFTLSTLLTWTPTPPIPLTKLLDPHMDITQMGFWYLSHMLLVTFYPLTKSEWYSFCVVRASVHSVRPHFLSVRKHISVSIGQIWFIFGTNDEYHRLLISYKFGQNRPLNTWVIALVLV